jgi:hypothetical protein
MRRFESGSNSITLGFAVVVVLDMEEVAEAEAVKADEDDADDPAR